jgi:nucleoside-triphosphatase
LRIALSGPPGSGKTTIVRRAVQLLRTLGCRPLGFYTPDVRESGRRIGFIVEDVETGKTVWLAKRGLSSKYRIGSYGIIEDAGEYMCNIIRQASRADIAVIDEVGPMELVFPCMRSELVKLLNTNKSFLIVYHRRLKDRYPDLYRLITSKATVLWVTEESRSMIWEKVKELISESCNATGGGVNDGIHG